MFALANGHIGMRANLDEGEPFGLPGTYLNSFYELRPLPHAEAGYGYPESGQTLVNVTDGKIIRLLVDDEPFDLRYGELLRHERELDLRGGVLRRTVEWVSPAGDGVRVSSTRLVSFAQRAAAAILYEVEPLDGPVRVVVQSELVANGPVPVRVGDPRAAAALDSPLQAEEHSAYANRVVLVHSTRSSKLRLAAAMDHLVEGPDNKETSIESAPDVGRVTIAADLAPGETAARGQVPGLRLLEPALARRRQGSAPSRRSPRRGTPAGMGWSSLSAPIWTISGGAPTSSSTATPSCSRRFASRSSTRCRPAREPSSARSARRASPAPGTTATRSGTRSVSSCPCSPTRRREQPPTLFAGATRRSISRAIERPSSASPGPPSHGARFVGTSARGTGPPGTAAFHIGADIADAVVRYQHAADDEPFEREVGIELLVETARLWRSLGHHDAQGRFRIDGVTGPDEYSAIADNNVYTNLMAQRNLRAAADAVGRHPRRAAELGADFEEAATWRHAAESMIVPWDDDLGVHPQSEGFTDHQTWDFAATDASQYPLLLHFPYFDLYRKQVVKQADLVLALHACGDAFTDEEKARDFAYYEALTVRDSSLSACTQAVVAAEVGHLELAYDYFAEAALMDFHDLEHNTSRRVAHCVARRRLDRGGCRLRRDARPRWTAQLRAPTAAPAGAARFPPLVPRQPARGAGHGRSGDV